MHGPITPRSATRLPIYLDDILFPASRREILRCAEDNDAPDELLDMIEGLPDCRYWSVREIVTRMQVPT